MPTDTSFTPKAAPTQAPQKRKRRSAESEYKKSLTEKQTLKRWYGLSEKQFKRYVQESLKKMGKVDDVSEELIGKLERRLDNVVFRLGFAKTRRMARQLVSHGFFTVNGKRVNIPSYVVVTDDVVAIKENKKKKGVFTDESKKAAAQEIHSWLKLEKNKTEGKAVGKPTLLEVKPPAEISQIFEFYSR